MNCFVQLVIFTMNIVSVCATRIPARIAPMCPGNFAGRDILMLGQCFSENIVRNVILLGQIFSNNSDSQIRWLSNESVFWLNKMNHLVGEYESAGKHIHLSPGFSQPCLVHGLHNAGSRI